jgi:hypothetical protein
VCKGEAGAEGGADAGGESLEAHHLGSTHTHTHTHTSMQHAHVSLEDART